jgi:hypothetical protein
MEGMFGAGLVREIVRAYFKMEKYIKADFKWKNT